jgi:acetoin utilization deacetylase AcuC-like enzyme
MGTTLNVTLPAGTSEEEYLAEFEGKVLKAVDDFGPEFLLVSAGFDGHIDDPLAELRLTEDGFTRITRGLKKLAAANCKGRLISCLEGGYNLDALERSVAAHVLALME